MRICCYRRLWYAGTVTAALFLPSAEASSLYLHATSGGKTTTTVEGRNAFSQPAANLSFTERLDFSVGNSFFRNPWVSSPASTDARDGLGPLFNTNSCQGCHIKDGRGHLPANADDNAVSLLIRFSVGDSDQPDPIYGSQLQDVALPEVPAEGKIQLNFTERSVHFADGQSVSLQKPKFTITDLSYGPLHPDVRLSPRIAPAMIGLGLLEAVPAEQILAWIDNPALPEYITPKANWVMAKSNNQLALGRFGWKAGQPSLKQQNAAAFAGDLGITSNWFLQDDCTPTQTACLASPDGGQPEVTENILNLVTFYTQHLAVPKRRHLDSPEVQSGAQLFTQIGCQHCHRPTLTTQKQGGSAALQQQTIFPYTDLLLHDMGDDLADHHVEEQATGREWRTPPLWGLGYLPEVNGEYALLHDGRARSIEEAILWHGGEAQTAQQNYRALDQQQRQQLIAFLRSL